MINDANTLTMSVLDTANYGNGFDVKVANGAKNQRRFVMTFNLNGIKKQG